MSGRIDAASTALITAMPLIKARKVRALAIMNEERTAVLPALATVSRQGIPGYNYAAWFGFGAPAATCSSIKKVHDREQWVESDVSHWERTEMINISEWTVRIAGVALGSAVWLGAGSAVAQSLGACGGKPVAVIIPSTAGGPLDREGRVYLNKLSTFSGQQYVMDFKPGAGTTIGTAFAARAPGDGCTLIAISGSFPVFPAFYSNLSFDIIRDFAYVSQMSQRTTVLMVRNEFPARTFPEYLAYARTNPGKINLATAGAGGIQHLAGAWLHQASNTQVTFVHYKGASQAVLDVVAGRVDALPTTAISALPLVRAGKVRVLALGNNRLSKHLPELRPISEQGVPGYNYSAWMGFAAPGATPVPIVNRLSEGFAKVARSEDIIASQDAEGSVMIGNTPEEFREIVLTEMRIWQKLVKETGIKIEE